MDLTLITVPEGPRTLTTLPAEVIRELGFHLSDLDHSALRMVNKTLLLKCGDPRSLGEEGMSMLLDASSTILPSALSVLQTQKALPATNDHAEYWEHNKRYEASHRATHYPSLLLLCTSCMQHQPRPNFQDSKSKKVSQGARVCVECSIACDFYNNTAFMWGGINKFWCSGCKVIMPVHNEYGRANEGCYVMERATAKAKALRTGRKAEEIDTGGRKWCAPCWRAILMWDVAQNHQAALIQRRRQQRRETRARARRALAAQQ